MFLLNRLYHGGRDEGGGYRHDALDRHYHTTVVTNTDELALDALEHPTGDADTGALGKIQFRRVEINQRLFVVTRHSNEIAHLVVGDDDWATGLTVQDVTDRNRKLGIIVDVGQLTTGDTDDTRL